MTLSAGTRLGPYEISSPLGAGGMGEVYRARDTRLGREVAIKVLPAAVSADPERLKRFETEARSASSLNHPNIVTIHDIGESGGIAFIAMEIVDGQTLREMVTEGALPTKRLLTIAAQVADGLAKAHGARIVHRDLKPENVMVTRDGLVKILDFGLVKLTQPETARGQESHTPTLSKGTEPGVVMGTVGYMSPEQALGKAVDFRADQFSLGSILYELATGKRAFVRGSAPETLSAIIRDEPEPMANLSPLRPAPLRWIIERCLAKNPGDRYASTVDLARDLANLREHISEISGAAAALSPGTRPKGRERLAWVAAAVALVAGLAVGLLVRGRAAEGRSLARLSMTFLPGESPEPQDSPILALSPDGTRLVYVGRGAAGGHRLYVRELARFEATPIPGTDGGEGPFFSPDGQWVGFGADKQLKKVSLAGGQPLILCDAPTLRGASWGTDGTILFAPSGPAPLLRISDRGGETKPATVLDPKKGEHTHRWPQILPGGKAAIFTIHALNSSNYDNARIGILLLDTGERRTVLEGGTDARYVPSGHLVYLRAGSLFAVPFDLERLAVTGPPVPVLDGISVFGPAGFAHYSVSPSGSLVYLPLDPKEGESGLVSVDRKGAIRAVTDLRQDYSAPRLSPDGRRLAVCVGGQESGIWVYDFTRNAWERLISGGLNALPVWSSDGERVAFASNRGGPISVFWMPVDRSASAEQLTNTERWVFPYSASPDGRTLLVETQSPATGSDISVLSLEGERTLRPFLHTSSNETSARFSPDGRFITYESNESGRSEVYVTPYPGPGGRWQVSTDGGASPVWSRDGRELFYRSGEKMMTASVETRPTFRAGVPKLLFELPGAGDYDVAPDGQRFVMIRTPKEESAPRSLAVVLGWLDDLKRRASAGKQ